MPDADIPPARHISIGFTTAALAAAAATTIVLTVLAAVGARSWIGQPFAGWREIPGYHVFSSCD